MYTVGITGPIGAGKTLALQAFKSHDALLLDCDDIYHNILETNTRLVNDIAEAFPGVTEDGRVDRKKLGELVFNNPQSLSLLNTITHKYVLDEVKSKIKAFEASGGQLAVIAAIALFESGFHKRCDTILCITAPQDVRAARIMARDDLTREQADVRINAQNPEDFYKSNSTVIIENNYTDSEDLQNACRQAIDIDMWFHRHSNDMITQLGELVKIDSVRGKSEEGAPFGKKSREALKLGQKMLERHGLSVDVFDDMVITAKLGPSPAALGILTHLDVVEAGEHWDTDPYRLTIRDGKLFGRGVMDNKGPAVASLYAALCVRELFPDMDRGLQLIFGSGEETGFEDIAHYRAKNTLPADVFSPDAGFPVVNIEKGRFMCRFGTKWEAPFDTSQIISISGGNTPNIVPNSATAVITGIGIKDTEEFCKIYSKKTGVHLEVTDKGDNLLITAKGLAAHASRPHIGNNAQTALIEMLAAMPFSDNEQTAAVRSLSQLFPHNDYHGISLGIAMYDEKSGKTTVNFGVLQLDNRGFAAAFDARTAICADHVDISGIAGERLRREGMTVVEYELKPSHHTPEDSPFIKTLLHTYEKYTGLPGKCLCVGGLTYVHGIPGAVAFGCNISDDDNNIHAANEYIEIDHLIKCAKMFTQVIIDVCRCR